MLTVSIFYFLILAHQYGLKKNKAFFLKGRKKAPLSREGTFTKAINWETMGSQKTYPGRKLKTIKTNKTL